MEKHIFLRLLDKYLAGKASQEEEGLLEEYYRRLDEKSKLELSEREELTLQQLMLKNIWDQVNDEGNVVQLKPRRKFTIWYAAASIVIGLSVGSYLLLHKQKQTPQISQNQKQDIAPGGNKATLTIANGQTIVLTGAKNGQLAIQGNMAVTKTADGEVVYEASKSEIAHPKSEIAYNTMTTPRGGKYDLTLADGTKVWLDAASSITYPVAFTGNNRSVKITGQAYFEVAHNAAKPFRVSVHGETVEVLGTHFNINAYGDESVMKTTLLEGSVKVSKSDQTALLKPGQQSIIDPNSNSIIVKDVDTEVAMAWKNGYFLFDDENLESVMRKVSRWYDVDIQYPTGQKITETYGGSITRYGNVSKVLDMLEITGHVKFKIEGKNIIVQNK